MAEQEFRIGSVGPLTYDDAVEDGAFVTTGTIRASGVPTDPDDLVRLSDLTGTVAGFTGTVTVVTNVQLTGGGAIEVKTKLLTFADGLLSTVGAESGWTATPL